MHTKQQLSEMKNEHESWQDRLRFYKEEISHFNQHLGSLLLRAGRSVRWLLLSISRTSLFVRKKCWISSDMISNSMKISLKHWKKGNHKSRRKVFNVFTRHSGISWSSLNAFFMT